MANNNINQNENILVTVDQQNIIHIDPNSVVDSNGQIQSRLVNHENLVMYVNLEADLIPRTTLFTNNEQNSLFSVAQGTFNLLRNQGDKNEFENNFDTNWTDTFVGKSERVNLKLFGLPLSFDTVKKQDYDPTAQTFGIESISIVVKGANNIPQVTINFVDVRGKTLFESPSNSPYKAFFHQPWPIFYLTVKGYYGKAIRYRLQLVDFKSRFNGSSGNFEITTKFVGSTYAFLNDILLQNAINAPFMYMVEKQDEPYRINEKTGFVEKKILKTTKGYSILKSVYSDYMAKGYIPKDFPTKTLRDLLMTAKGLDKIIETQLFSGTVDPSVLAHIAEYDVLLDSFERAVVSWGNRYLVSNQNEVKSETLKGPDGRDKIYRYFRLNKPTNDQTKVSGGAINPDVITNKDDKTSLQGIINRFIDGLEKNTAFGKNITNNKEVKTVPISLDKVRNISDFYFFDGSTYGVAIEKLVDAIKSIQTTFVTSRKGVEDKVEEKMNEIISNPNLGGFGFKPTIRNIFAVILANADTYIRLMKDVHTKGIQKSKERASKFTKPSDQNKEEYFYPWPEVLKKDESEREVAFYPADPAITEQTKGNDFSLWPEVEFIETYNSVATKRVDPLSGTEIAPSELTFVIDGDNDERNVKHVSSFFKIDNLIPYTNKSIGNLLYEIYERAFFVTSYDNFEYGSGLDDIVNNEVENLKSSLAYDIDIIDLIKNQVKTTESLVTLISRIKERNPFFQNRLSTVDYIKELVDQDFELIDFDLVEVKTSSDTTQPNLKKAIDDYEIEPYRLTEFPFNSNQYETYFGRKLTEIDYKYKNVFSININNSFISSPVKPESWIKDTATKNIFVEKINLQSIDFDGNTTDFYENMLNTPYFHKQLYSDFFKGGVNERYVGSAYLLLNSLPYKNLNDQIDFNGSPILMSSLFKEIGATHFVPYHLILKWGSQYHRYKKYLKEGVDIISGVTTPISGSTYFDNATNLTFDLSGITPALSAVTYNSEQTIGIYPYYFGIFHQITNGYSFYNPSGFTSVSASTTDVVDLYETTITSGITKYSLNTSIGSSGYSITSFVDNSKFKSTDLRYTILPSAQINDNPRDLATNFDYFEQDAFKIILDNPGVYQTTTPYNTFYLPSYDEEFKNTNNTYSLIGEQRKFLELIATFSPKLLDEMESQFLEFASLDLKLDSSNNTHDYNTFQSLLKAICSIPNTGIDFSSDGHKIKILQNQIKNLEEITKSLLENKNLKKLTIGNPRQIDNYTLFGFSGFSQNYFVGTYNSSQATSENLKLIELYIGHNLTGATYSGITNNIYRNFFEVNNIRLDEENIISHRELARIYAGWVKSQRDVSIGFTPTRSAFVTYIGQNITREQDRRLLVYLDNLIRKLSQLEKPNENNKITIYHGFNEAKTTKLDLYQFFKSFNDKWISGNAVGQRHLMDEFLFLDRTNSDIGDKAYISLERLISLSNERNIKVDLYSAISILIQGTNFDMKPLPAYVNFYGTNSTNKKKITPSKNLAKNLFGTHLDVDYQDATPKIILQYVNGTSKYLDMSRISKEFKFKNDGFDIKDTTNNPLLVEPKIFMDSDLSRSNRVVSFEVNFGDYSQSIFKEVSLDQSTYKNTNESALAQERLARSQGGGGTHQIDIGLFDIYKTASYQCTVTMMGNVMIQPTMYFYLANIPMFEGTYLVFDVTHQIRGNTIETSLTGVRLSASMLPNLENSFMASYRPLFSRILSAAIKKKQQIDNQTTTEKTITLSNNQNALINPGDSVAGEDFNKLIVKENGFYKDFIPYNGVKYNGKEEKYIQLIDLGGNDNRWLRARVARMGGSTYSIDDSTNMLLISGINANPNPITWSNIKTTLSEYYSVRVNSTQANKETIFGYKTEFLNPRTNTKYILQPLINNTAKVYNGLVTEGPSETIGNFGVGMSSLLMKKLKVNEGDVVYFRLI
jgi:hypothetical protein